MCEQPETATIDLIFEEIKEIKNEIKTLPWRMKLVENILFGGIKILI